MTFHIMTPSITTLCHYPECRCTKCQILFIVMMNVVMLNVFTLSVLAPLPQPIVALSSLLGYIATFSVPTVLVVEQGACCFQLDVMPF